MDETGVGQKNNTKRVICVQGLRNMWEKIVEASFHLTIVACISAPNQVVPPMFMFHGKRLNKEVMDDYCVKGSTITISPKRFTNNNIFSQWLGHLKDRIPFSTNRYIMLIFDGCKLK